MASSSCAEGDHVFDPAVELEQWIAIGSASAALEGAATCQCGELAIAQIESRRDAHWPLWPFYLGQRTDVTDTGSLPKAFRSTVRVSLESGAPARSGRGPLRPVG
jgi:hypothetical protein